MAQRGTRFINPDGTTTIVYNTTESTTGVSDSDPRLQSVYDINGTLISSPNTGYVYGPRGTRTNARTSFDSMGNVVEIDYLEKKKLYLLINDTTLPKSERVKAIETRIANATKTALSYVASLELVYKDDEIDLIYKSVSAALSIAGVVVAGVAGGQVGAIIGSFVKPPDFSENTKPKFREKAILLNQEIEKLNILRRDLTGEYLQYDALGKLLNVPTEVRSASSNQTLLWGLIILAFLIGIYFYFRRSNAIIY